MRRIIRFVFQSGLIMAPVWIIAAWQIVALFGDVVFISENMDLILKGAFVVGSPVVLTIYTYRKNNKAWNSHYHSKLSFGDFLRGKEPDEEDTPAFLKATYPEVRKEYLKNKPMSWVLGFEKGKYICFPLLMDGLNVFGVGTPGSGKSTLMIGWLLANIYQASFNIRKKQIAELVRWNFFTVDIKGEIFRRILKIEGRYKAKEGQTIHVVEPANRDSWGWDVFYLIHKDGYVSDTVKLKMVTDIAVSLVPETGDNPYFAVNARKIFGGVMFYYLEKDCDFVDIIQTILRENLGELLKVIVETAEVEGNVIVLDKLKGFVGKTDNESIQDVESTLKQYLEVFCYPDIVFCLKNNTNRTSPRALNDGVTSIDLAIEESMLLTYQPLFRLISMQILNHVSTEFKESDKRITSIIIDEAKRVGKIDGLDDTLATARSKHVNIVLLFQDLSQFRDLYGKEKADSILNICEMKIFLSGAGDKSTTEYLSDMVGQYVVEKKSYSKKGLVVNGQADLKYSQEHRHIINGKSLMRLRENKEMIVIYYGHYYRFNKLEYFKDKYLGPIAREIAEYNEAHEND